MLNARLAELADALDLGSSGQPWGFESPLSHQEGSASFDMHRDRKVDGKATAQLSLRDSV